MRSGESDRGRNKSDKTPREEPDSAMQVTKSDEEDESDEEELDEEEEVDEEKEEVQ